MEIQKEWNWLNSPTNSYWLLLLEVESPIFPFVYWNYYWTIRSCAIQFMFIFTFCSLFFFGFVPFVRVLNCCVSVSLLKWDISSLYEEKNVFSRWQSLQTKYRLLLRRPLCKSLTHTPTHTLSLSLSSLLLSFNNIKNNVFISLSLYVEWPNKQINTNEWMEAFFLMTTRMLYLEISCQSNFYQNFNVIRIRGERFKYQRVSLDSVRILYNKNKVSLLVCYDSFLRRSFIFCCRQRVQAQWAKYRRS
jgi:hypothetical protein